MPGAPWAILDFPGPEGAPVREVYRNPTATVEARTAGEVRAALDEVERLARSGLTLVGFVAYDAAPGLEPKFEIRPGYEGPLVWFLAGHPERSEGSALPDKQILRYAQDDKWVGAFDPADYRAKVNEIIEGIERGDFYQVNLTERFSSVVADPLAVYERLRAAQAAPYSAFVQTAEMAVLSVSPELFLHRSGTTIESRPMKGTSRRGRWVEEDDGLARQLAESEKERAENVMIVDLVRNDMGRIAVPGSVVVPSMFSVERYPTVLQMTSHVRSQLRRTTTLGDVFAALFPCGSVTGAPKIAASKSIARLEATPRAVYCGAVGVVRPGGDDFTFNVAIRTVTVAARDGRATYGAGGGITADSNPDRELAELEAKAAVLTSVPRSIELLETLRLENGAVVRLDRHMRRMSRSAEYFGFGQVDRRIDEVRHLIAAETGRFPAGTFRMRVTLRPDGTHGLTTGSHSPDTRPRRVAVARTPVDSGDRHLHHKLADRSVYEARLAEVAPADDAILINERGELTELTIGNLVLRLDGALVTPPLASGLLPGIFREELLESGQVAERVIYAKDLGQATEVWMINSLREWVRCEISPASGLMEPGAAGPRPRP